MFSETQICNMALRRIGLNPISSLGAASQEARDCSLYYGQFRDTVLRDHDWTFARKRRSLASFAIPNDYAGKYLYGYVLPADCLKPLKVYELNGSVPQDFELFRADTGDRFLMTDIPGAVLKYTMAVTDTSWFDAEFVEALARKLAGVLAVPLAKNTKLMEYWENEYMKAIDRAKVSNMTENMPRKETDDTPWITARTAH